MNSVVGAIAFILILIRQVSCVNDHPGAIYGWGRPTTSPKYTPRTYKSYYEREGYQIDPQLKFTATDQPPRPNQYIIPSLFNQSPVKLRNYLSFGASRVLEGCDVYGAPRIHCNHLIKKPSPEQCRRWFCCYDPAQPVVCAKNKYFIIRLAEEPDPNQCGIQPQDFKAKLNIPLQNLILLFISERIIGGKATLQGDWPWMVSLRLDNSPICGGTLIDEEWILTARHCIDHPNALARYTIVLSELNTVINSTFDLVKQIIAMEENTNPGFTFSAASFNNDIVLLKFSTPVKFDKFRRPVCLPAQGTPTDSDTAPTFAGDTCTVIGWGATETMASSDILLRAEVIILGFTDCRTQTTNAFLQYIPKPQVNDVREHKFCAAGTATGDTCQGDSGGPLLCLGPDNRFYIHGITSYGPASNCGQFPAIYTRVSDFSDWINSIIN